MSFEPGHWYRARAEQLRKIAAAVRRQDHRKALLDVALEYERMASRDRLVKTEEILQLFKKPASEGRNSPASVAASRRTSTTQGSGR